MTSPWNDTQLATVETFDTESPFPVLAGGGAAPPLAHESAEESALRHAVGTGVDELSYQLTPSGAELWVPGAERLGNARSAGGTYLPAPWRFVFHTIEGEPGEKAFRALAARHTTPPHLWAMPKADLLLQTVPLNRSAYALARPGAIQTNRLHAVQVELWGFAAKMDDAGDQLINWLAERLLAPVARLVPINLGNVRPRGSGNRCYGTESPCRMTAAEWQVFDGVCGHKDVPANKHWDPGRLDMAAIATRAKAIVAGPARQQEQPASAHDGPGFEAEYDETEHDETEQPWLELSTEDQAPAPFVPPPPPNPPLSGPVPISRLCCLFDEQSMKGTETMGGYSLASSAASGKPGTVYTGKAGFVDLGHLYSVLDVTAFGYQQIHAAGGAAGTTVRTANGAATLTSTAPNTQWLELARSIAYDDAYAYEIDTYKGRLRAVPGHLNSAFSPEDLVSNYLGTVVAQRAITAGGAPGFRMSFPAQADKETRELLVSLGAQSEAETKKAFAKVGHRWVDPVRMLGRMSPDYLRRRNFTRTPWLAGHPSDGTPPSWLAAPFALTSGYSYRHTSGLTNAAFGAEVTLIRVDAAQRFGPSYDKPN